MRSIISAILGIVTLLAGLRFVLLILGVSPDINLISWIYTVSAPLVAPFAGYLPQPTAIAKGISMSSVFDWAPLLALVVYELIGSLVAHTYHGHGSVHHA